MHNQLLRDIFSQCIWVFGLYFFSFFSWKIIGGETIKIPKRPGEPDCTFADISKIRTELSWKPSVPIEVGMELLIENINYWADAPVWDPNSISKATKDWFKYLE